MRRFVLRRLRWTAGVLLAVSLLAFGLQEAAPGDPARLLLQAAGREVVTEDDLIAVRARLHLDRSIGERYVAWLGRAVQGDFGRSFRSYEPVAALYLERLPNTALLALVASTMALAVALPLGLLSGSTRNRWIDGAVQGFVGLGAAVPGFWLALILILVFASTLRWLPAFGSPTPAGIVLPATVLALQKAAVLTRLVRSATLDTLAKPWVAAARAKGLGGRVVMQRHVLPAVLAPVLAVYGLELANLLTGAAVVEYVFAWPGIGKLAIDSVLSADIPMVVAFALFAGLTFVFVNLVVDVASALVDPALRPK